LPLSRGTSTFVPPPPLDPSSCTSPFVFGQSKTNLPFPGFSHFSNFHAMCVRVFSACVPVCECVCLFFATLRPSSVNKKATTMRHEHGRVAKGVVFEWGGVAGDSEESRRELNNLTQLKRNEHRASGIPRSVQQLVLLISGAWQGGGESPQMPPNFFSTFFRLKTK